MKAVEFPERAGRLTVTPSTLHPRRIPLFFSESGLSSRATPPDSGPVMKFEFIRQTRPAVSVQSIKDHNLSVVNDQATHINDPNKKQPTSNTNHQSNIK